MTTRRSVVALLLAAMLLLTVLPAAAAQGPQEGKNGTDRAPSNVQELLSGITCMLSNLFDALPVPDFVSQMFHRDSC